MNPIAVSLVVFVISVTGHSLELQERSWMDFKEMIKQVSGRSAIKYINYGNWCTLKGKGEPVDDIDKCCKEHKECYKVNRETCSAVGMYLAPYKWTIKDKIVTCDPANEPCQTKNCECDKIAAECFAKGKYDESHQGKITKIVAMLLGKFMKNL